MTPHKTAPPDSAKARARAAATARRARAHVAAQTASEAVCARFWHQIGAPAGAAIAGYWPIRTELDPRPLLAQAIRRGHPCALPVVTAPDRPLIFRRWRPGDGLVTGPFGVAAPGPGAEEIIPDIVLTPLLAFDRAGHRLGYGAGCYDRTLARLRRRRRVLAVGLAYAAQQADRIPVDDNDQPLDWILTETEGFQRSQNKDNKA